MMNELEYKQQTERLFSEVESFLDEVIDTQNDDVDYERAGNALRITFPNHSNIILNTQAPLQQIWLATKNQGYHFDFKGNDWICDKTQQPFKAIFLADFNQQLNDN